MFSYCRLDDTRSAQQHRDLLELEYDRAELEDWSFSLSTEDLAQNEIVTWKDPVITPALPAIKEQNPVELEEDANECLWNGASYLADRTGGELVIYHYCSPLDVKLFKPYLKYQLNNIKIQVEFGFW